MELTGYSDSAAGNFNNCINYSDISGESGKIGGILGGVVAWNVSSTVMNNCYSIEIQESSAVNTANILSMEDFKTDTLLENLNNYVREKDEFAFWIKGNLGYPILDLTNINKIAASEES